MPQKMIKKSFLNPGAYVIFIKSLKNDGLRWVDIGEIMGTSGAYPQSVVQGKANPKYGMVERADVGFKEYFHTHEDYKRHLRKKVEVYESDDCVDWLENHEDFEKNGGEYVKLIPSLNDNDDWVRNFAEYLAEKEEEFVTK